MELRLYWQIIWKRAWLVVILVGIVAVMTMVTYHPPAPTYAATLRFNVGLLPVPPTGADYTYNPLDTWMASEYLMDDLASAVRGGAFAAAVQSRLGVEAPSLAGAFGAATEHRVLSVYITWGDASQLADIANAAVAVLEEDSNAFVGPLGNAQPVLRLIDPPVIFPVGRSLKQKLDIPLRLGLAFIVGVALTFLLDYLDTSLRDRSEVEQLGFTVLGEIPPLPDRRRWPWQRRLL